ncbi:MAG TPA: hypothetical protein VMV89_10285 [Candidatus Paceibacterota bacterium]|nr:hypothetical protein [Candidatus Paceibacterota bacterium]
MKTTTQQILKKISISFLLLLICQCCFATEDTNIIAAGDWSAPTNGLRARLLFSEDAKFNGTEMGVVYLELQNVSDAGNPMEVYYNIDHALHCQIADASDKPFHQPEMMDADIMSPGSYWLVLPHDSTLRFRISVNGWGIPKDGGLLIGLMSVMWLIPPTMHTDLFFSGSFNVNPPQNRRDGIPAWKGVLKLPPVKIPVKRLPEK